MLKELTEDLNSRMHKAENQMNDLEHKETKQPIRTRRKKESKKMRIV